MAYKITVNQKECIGCGSCAAICSKSFAVKKKAEVLKEIIEILSCETAAADACPVGAITITEQ